MYPRRSSSDPSILTLILSDGFYLDENASEALYLDDIIFKDLDPSLREELKFQQYYGSVIA